MSIQKNYPLTREANRNAGWVCKLKPNNAHSLPMFCASDLHLKVTRQFLFVITYTSQGDAALRNNSQMHINKPVLKNYLALLPESLIQ